MSERNPTGFAALLRMHRDAAGLTQQELAERAALGVRTVSDLERGVSTAPYPSTVRRLADALQLSTRDRELLHAATRWAAANPASALTRTAGRSGQGRFSAQGPGTDRAAAARTFLIGDPDRVPPLAGRRFELTEVGEVVGAARSGAGRMLLVTGEPGIGKTRLAYEAASEALDRGFAEVAVGRCYPSQQTMPFVPWFEILEQLFHVAPPQVRSDILVRWPYLARLLPGQFPAHTQFPERSQDVHRLFQAVAAFVRAVATERPLVLVVDDVHAADDASIDLLAHLTRHVSGVAVLVVVTCRGAELDGRRALRAVVHELDRERLVTTIGLQGLDRPSTTALIQGQLDPRHGSEDLFGALYRRSDGNPFFVVELVRDLRDRLSAADGADGREAVQGAVPDPLPGAGSEVPRTVQEAVLARVARLSPAAGQLLEAASVLGQSFAHEELLLVFDPGEDAAAGALDEAERSGLVDFDGQRFGFDHAITQEALYATLSAARRRRLHRAAGLGLASRRDDVRNERAAHIAEHLRLGGEAGQASVFFLLAGRRATTVFAHAEAERLFRLALELATAIGDTEAQARAREQLGAVLTARARYDEAMAELDEASAQYERVGSPEGVGRVEAVIAGTHFRRGTPAVGARRLAQFIATRPEDPDSAPARADAMVRYGVLARLHYANGQYAACREAAERALRFSPGGDSGLLAEVELMRGIGLLWTREPAAGVSALLHAVELAERAAAYETWCTACLPLHLHAMARGDVDAARAYSRLGISIAERTGDPGLLGMHLANLANQDLHRGAWPAAEAAIDRALDLSRVTPASYFSCLPVAYQGALRSAQGRWDEAVARLDEAAALAVEVGNPEVAGYAETKAAQVEVARGRAEEALARIDRSDRRRGTVAPTWWYDALRLTVLAEAHNLLDRPLDGERLADRAGERARSMQNRVDDVEAQRVRAQGLAGQGRFAEADATLAAALAEARSMSYPHAEAKLLNEAGRIAAHAGERAVAEERFSAAAQLFRDLGAVAEASQGVLDANPS